MALLSQGVIHTDFEKGFICAEVMTFEDLKELGDEEAVKKAGKLRQQGKKYVVQDADVIFFKVCACVCFRVSIDRANQLTDESTSVSVRFDNTECL